MIKALLFLVGVFWFIGIFIAIAMAPFVFLAKNPFEGFASKAGDIALYGLGVALFATIIGACVAGFLFFAS